VVPGVEVLDRGEMGEHTRELGLADAGREAHLPGSGEELVMLRPDLRRSVGGHLRKLYRIPWERWFW